jgi:hypothetical protein
MATRRRRRFLNFSSFTGGGGAVVATQLVGTGGEINRDVSAATGSTNVKRGGRRRSFLGNAETSEMQLMYGNWTTGTDTGEANNANSYDLQAHVEINGTTVQVAFGGVTTPVTVAAGDNIISDALLPADFGLVTFPRGLEFYIYSEQEVAEGEVFPTVQNSNYGVAVPGETYLRGTTGATTKIGSNGPIAAGGDWIAGSEVFAPLAILGKPVTPMMAVAVIGASIESGVNSSTGDGNSVSFAGGFNRKALATTGGSIHIPYTMMARASEKASTYVSSSAKRQELYQYITHAITGHGGNDYSGGATLAANLASNRSIHATIRTANPAIHISRLELYAKTDSTDSWATLVNQTPRTGMETGGAYRDPFNEGMADDETAGLIDEFVLFAPGVIVDATELDKFRVDITATTDGTHPQAAVHAAMATAEAARWEVLRETYEGAYTLDAATEAVLAGLAVAPNATRQTLIDQTVRWFKNSDLWDNFDVIGMIGDTQEISLRNWKAPGTFTATLAGTIVYTADRQFATAGAGTSYIDTNFNPATAGGHFTQNAASFGAWFAPATASDSSRAGWFDGTDGITLVPRSTGAGFSFRINQAANSTNGGAGGVVDGMQLVNRSGSGATQSYTAGVLGTVNTNPNQVSTTLNSHNLQLGAVTAAAGVIDSYAGWVIGGSFTAVQADIINRIFTSYMNKIGAA